MTTIRKHWLVLLLVAIAVANLALGQYLWAGLLCVIAAISALRSHFWPLKTETGQAVPSTRIFVTFLVGVSAVGVLMTVLAVENRNGARPFALVAAVLCAGIAIATVVAIVKLRRAERRNAGQADDDGP